MTMQYESVREERILVRGLKRRCGLCHLYGLRIVREERILVRGLKRIAYDVESWEIIARQRRTNPREGIETVTVSSIF